MRLPPLDKYRHDARAEESSSFSRRRSGYLRLIRLAFLVVSLLVLTWYSRKETKGMGLFWGHDALTLAGDSTRVVAVRSSRHGRTDVLFMALPGEKERFPVAVRLPSGSYNLVSLGCPGGVPRNFAAAPEAWILSENPAGCIDTGRPANWPAPVFSGTRTAAGSIRIGAIAAGDSVGDLFIAHLGKTTFLLCRNVPGNSAKLDAALPQEGIDILLAFGPVDTAVLSLRSRVRPRMTLCLEPGAGTSTPGRTANLVPLSRKSFGLRISRSKSGRLTLEMP